MEDKDILDLLHRNQIEGFRAAFDKYYNPLCVQAYLLIKDEAQAQDIVQELFIQLWQQGRLSQVLRESMKLLKQIVEENSTLRESIESINERQLKADQQISESKKSNEVLADLIKSGLPVTSMVRIARGKAQ